MAATDSAVETRLAERGLTVPEVAAPVASYVPARRGGPFVFTAGQLQLRDGRLLDASLNMKRGTASRLVKNEREARVVAIMRVEKASAEDTELADATHIQFNII